MLLRQSRLIVKDNSKIFRVKITNTFKKKNIKLNDPFLGVIKLSKNSSLKPGTVANFRIISTRKEKPAFSGKTKKSNVNACLASKQKKTLEPMGSRFIGFFFSEVRNIKDQKTKILINKCI